MFEGIGASLVWDGGSSVAIPNRLPRPRDDQMVGTVAEQLTELSGRICYDSLGSKNSRGSNQFFEHILQVGHYSVAEHYHASILLESREPSFIDMLSFLMLNRPWVWVTPLSPNAARLTMNCRAVMEYAKWSVALVHLMPDYPIHLASHLGVIIQDCFHEVAPQLIRQPHPAEVSIAVQQVGLSKVEIVAPDTDAECWLSFYIFGSRGLSHEIVRHGDFSAISQRSTRFCDETDSPWVFHPLLQQYILTLPEDERSKLTEVLSKTIEQSRNTYSALVESLVPFVLNQSGSSEKLSARKQARGAARGFLGNALETELIFTASVLEWRHIIKMRASSEADAEIRYAVCEILNLCKNSRYGDRFVDMNLTKSVDGVGLVLVS